MKSVIARPIFVSGIAVINSIAALIHILFWSFVFIKINSNNPGVHIEKNTIATIYGFGLADLIWSAPLLLLSAFGLWKMRFWGWLLAQWCNVLYWYSLTVVFVRDFKTNTVSPGGILFSPFALFAIWAALTLYKKRDNF